MIEQCDSLWNHRCSLVVVVVVVAVAVAVVVVVTIHLFAIFALSLLNVQLFEKQTC